MKPSVNVSLYESPRTHNSHKTSRAVSFVEPSGKQTVLKTQLLNKSSSTRRKPVIKKSDSICTQTGECEPVQIEKADSNLDHLCSLDINAPTPTHRMTRIMCSIVPASLKPEVLKDLVQKGMTVAILNLLNNSIDQLKATIYNMQEMFMDLCQTEGFSVPIGIGIETTGPRLYTGNLKFGEKSRINLENGSTIRLTGDQSFAYTSTFEDLYISTPNLVKVLNVNDPIYLADGAIKLVCTKIVSELKYIICLIEKGGVIGSSVSVFIPTAMVALPTLSKDDISAVTMAGSQELDFVFISFVRSANCIKSVRGLLGQQSTATKVIAKIDNYQGVKNIGEIMCVADGIMVDRAALRYELSSNKIYVVQKNIIARCRKLGLPVMTMNETLDSMMTNLPPTRFEVCDIANAVIEGVDCVVLHKETSEGPAPVESVIALDRILREAEGCIWPEQMFSELVLKLTFPAECTDSIARSAVELANKCGVKIIIVLTTSGRTVNLIANYRPQSPIIAVTKNPIVARQLNIYRGVFPLYYSKNLPSFGSSERGRDIDVRVMYGIQYAVNRKFLKQFDPVVVVTGWRPGSGFTNTVRFVYVPLLVGPYIKLLG